MYFYLIIALQAYCIYHAYSNNKPFYWYLAILFVPALGSLVYLISQVYNKSDSDKTKVEVATTSVVSTKRIKDLEKNLEFIDSYSSRIDLADAYFDNNDIANAIINYNKTLEDTVQDDLYARQKLILCYFQLKDYAEVISHAEHIKEKSEFKGSTQQFCYGLSLNESGRVDEAEIQLKQIDRPYSNYAERLELAKFYVEHNRASEGKELLTEISTESQRFTQPNRKLFGATITEVERMLAGL